MEFNSNISPVDVIKRGAFGGDIYSNLTGKFSKNSSKNLKS